MPIKIRENGKERVVTIKEFEEEIKPRWRNLMNMEER